MRALVVFCKTKFSWKISYSAHSSAHNFELHGVFEESLLPVKRFCTRDNQIQRRQVSAKLYDGLLHFTLYTWFVHFVNNFSK